MCRSPNKNPGLVSLIVLERYDRHIQFRNSSLCYKVRARYDEQTPIVNAERAERSCHYYH